MATKRTKFFVAKMDCPTEEQLIRRRLERAEGIRDLRFNLLERELTVDHDLETDEPIVDRESGADHRRIDAG